MPQPQAATRLGAMLAMGEGTDGWVQPLAPQASDGLGRSLQFRPACLACLDGVLGGTLWA